MMRKCAILPLILLTLWLAGCAKMGQPDGGWYDETPPHVVACTPIDKAVDAHSKKIFIYFDEFIKIDNPTEKVVVSPPQLEAPIIKGEGKRISIQLNDSLKPNTTYTIDFSDAISDNNEGNPLGNYTYSFSTGESIDTMEVAGYVLEAENLEPIKGILVGLYSNLADSAFQKEPMLRVSRTDSRGHFVIKGVAPGQYRAYALNDMDGNYLYSQKSEKLAFSHDIIVPTSKPDVRQDTIWRDSLHIDNIQQTGYTHFLPDDIALTAFTAELTERHLLKTERKDAEKVSFYFTYGDKQLPQIEGIDFDAGEAFLVETNLKQDTVHYWLRDTALVNRDTLNAVVRYMETDTLGVLQEKTDTVYFLAKTSFEKRLKEMEKEREKWEKEQEKAKKKGRPYLTEMPAKPLDVKFTIPTAVSPNSRLYIESPTPLERVDTARLHLSIRVDTNWVEKPLALLPGNRKNTGPGNQTLRHLEIVCPDSLWQEGAEYRLECDSAAFTDIYGTVSNKQNKGFKVITEDDYTTIEFNISHEQNDSMVVQLLDRQEKIVDETPCRNGKATFLYVKPGAFYLRAYIDLNGNGQWDTGDYDLDLQAEQVFYYPERIECKAKWTFQRDWTPDATPLQNQKRAEITKQKPDKEKKIRQQNATRARKLGIPYNQSTFTK